MSVLFSSLDKSSEVCYKLYIICYCTIYIDSLFIYQQNKDTHTHFSS